MCSFEYFRNLLCYRNKFLIAIPAAYQTETDWHTRLQSLSTATTIGRKMLTSPAKPGTLREGACNPVQVPQKIAIRVSYKEQPHVGYTYLIQW
jgi:hypothetical protein